MPNLQHNPNSTIAKNNFNFGANWKDFLNTVYDTDTLEKAKQSLKDFFECENLNGKTFIDIGCGSGLFSLAAFELGAEKIVSMDIDIDSVECCKYLHNQKDEPNNWQVVLGSALDADFMKQLGQFDLVYSWGVLHHTGKMWQAIDNCINLVKPNGLFYIAIYNKINDWSFFKDGRFGNSEFWLLEKKIYNKLPTILKNFVNSSAMFLLILVYLCTFRNPFYWINHHRTLRGMSWKTDIIDWLGGYPYEYATTCEIFKFFKDRSFVLKNLKTNGGGLLNNEFLFQKLA